MKKTNSLQYMPTKKTMSNQIKSYFSIFLLPTMIAFIIGFVWPFCWGLYLSFFKFKTLKFMEFNGVRNYILAFSDQTFLYSFFFTAVFAIIVVVMINLSAFALAYLLTGKLKGTTVFRTIFFMPNLIGGIVLAYVWKQILNDLINRLYDSALMLDPSYGFWGLVILLSWQQIGYMMIIYIAGLQNVPNDFVEAAKMDGASSYQILRRITIPSIMPQITICLFLSLTNAFKLFDQNLALTGGSPNKKTEMLALNIYNAFYSNATNLGIGQAKAVIFFILVVSLSLVQLHFTRKREVQL